MKKRPPFSFRVGPLHRGLPIVSLIFVSLVLGSCGGSGEVVEDPGDFELEAQVESDDEGPGELEVEAEVESSYDATEILARLTDDAVYEDPQQIADLAEDFNVLLSSRDFVPAKRQVEALAVDFSNRPMRASMAAAVMDKWNTEPPTKMTASDLEQAWEIRRVAKETDENLARERARQQQDRLVRQSETEAQREIEAKARKEAKVEAIGVWVESYQAATAEGRSALARVQTVLTEPSESGDLREACTSLFEAIQAMDEQALEAPDPVIATLLRKSWDRFRTASGNCTKGQMRDLSTQLLEGQKAMKNANGILQGYGKSL